ncbi:MAG: hypothetical protein JXA20_04540 [Spirochaetes bacterium]|nr:hypothetical protein [Spirochaetota bacterium]
MKAVIRTAVNAVTTAYEKSREWFFAYPVPYARELYLRGKADPKERNRILIIALSLLFLLDYFMFCFHIEKNILDIFPSIPLLPQRDYITLYLPGLDGKSLLPEQREIPEYDSEEQSVRFLFSAVSRGSIYENTSFAVPVNLRVRKVWLFGDSGNIDSGPFHCVIDVDADLIPDKNFVISGSEALFRKALEKTIITNVPAIKDVTVIEKGVPGKALWEL